MDVDLIEIEVDASFSNPLIRRAFLEVGSAMWLETVLISIIPVIEAAKRGIPLIFWGENPGVEDGYPLAGGLVHPPSARRRSSENPLGHAGECSPSETPQLVLNDPISEELPDAQPAARSGLASLAELFVVGALMIREVGRADRN